MRKKFFFDVFEVCQEVIKCADSENKYKFYLFESQTEFELKGYYEILNSKLN